MVCVRCSLSRSKLPRAQRAKFDAEMKELGHQKRRLEEEISSLGEK
jgi:hypothetical protein